VGKAGLGGGDISTSLEKRGVPTGVAVPLALGASLAIPGGGEIKTLKKMDELGDVPKITTTVMDLTDQPVAIKAWNDIAGVAQQKILSKPDGKKVFQSLFDGAQELTNLADDALPQFKAIVTDIASKTKGNPKITQNKTVGRMIEKAVLEYNDIIKPQIIDGKSIGVVDSLRGTVIIPDTRAFEESIAPFIQKNFDLFRKVKNNFYGKSYQQGLANIIMPNGSISEIQFLSPEMWNAKIVQQGHEIYKKSRTILNQSDAKPYYEMMNRLYGKALKDEQARYAKEAAGKSVIRL
jgi:hypothetical protein